MTRTPSPDPHDSSIAKAPRELDSRVSDGIHVQLLWHPDDGHVSVAVDDSKTAETFELAVCDGQRALDVFHHPYAYTGDTVLIGANDAYLRRSADTTETSSSRVRS